LKITTKIISISLSGIKYLMKKYIYRKGKLFMKKMELIYPNIFDIGAITDRSYESKCSKFIFGIFFYSVFFYSVFILFPLKSDWQSSYGLEKKSFLLVYKIPKSLFPLFIRVSSSFCKNKILCKKKNFLSFFLPP